jgi:hypothetical protein
MSDDRLKAEIWIMAHVRRCNAQGVTAMVARRGDARGGSLIVKINTLGDGCKVLSQALDPDGRPGWLAAFKGALVPETEADAYIARAVGRDPDLWVIEIEHKDGWHPFEGKVI